MFYIPVNTISVMFDHVPGSLPHWRDIMARLVARNVQSAKIYIDRVA